MKKHFSLFLFFALNFYFSQQTESLRIIKAKYDVQIQNIENSYADALTKASLRKRTKIGLKKNSEISALKLKRNLEYEKELEKIQSVYHISDSNLTASKDERFVMPEYPDGIDAFKKEIANNFNAGSEVTQEKGTLQSIVIFIIEKDGSILTAKGFGENPTFNRHAEIAVLLTKKKWQPATKDGIPQRARLRVPFTLNFE